MKITVETCVKAPLEAVWEAWNNPEDIVRWNAASADWHTTRADVDLRVGGRFSSRMEAKNGSLGFDFAGQYRVVEPCRRLEFVFEDNRHVSVVFSEEADGVKIVETFDADGVFSEEQQRFGWQAILDNFKGYVEGRH